MVCADKSGLPGQKGKTMKSLLQKYKRMPVELKSSGWYMVCNVFQNALGFITLPVYSRIMPAEQYGLYSVYLTWMNLLLIFTNLNLQYGVFNTAMIRYEKDRDGFISAMQGLTTVLSLGWLLIYLAASEVWNQLFQLPPILMVVMAFEMLLYPAKDYWSGKLRFEYKYKATVLYTMMLAVINPTVCILAILGAEGDRGSIRVLTAAIVNMIFYATIYVRNFAKGKRFYHKEYWKYAWKLGIPLVIYYVSQTIFNQFDKLMIQHMVGMDKAGIYSLVYSCSVVVVCVINAINGAYVPWKYQKLQKQAYKRIAMVSEWIAAGIGVILILVILAGPELIQMIAPAEYYEAIWIMPPVVGSLFFLFLAQLFINVEFYFEQKQALVKGSIFSAVINVVLNYFAIKRFGYVAAGYTTLVCYIVFVAANYYYMKKLCAEKLQGAEIYNIRNLCVLSVGFLFAMFAALLVYPYPMLRWGGLCLIVIMGLVFHKKIITIMRKELGEQ